jgi:hypothetical protein
MPLGPGKLSGLGSWEDAGEDARAPGTKHAGEPSISIFEDAGEDARAPGTKHAGEPSISIFEDAGEDARAPGTNIAGEGARAPSNLFIDPLS